MSLVRKLPLGQKLYGGFGVVLRLVAVLGVVVVIGMSSMNSGAEALSKRTIPAVNAVDDMSLLADALARHQREHLAATTPADTRSLEGEFGNDRASFAAAAATFGSLARTAAERDALAQVKASFARRPR